MKKYSLLLLAGFATTSVMASEPLVSAQWLSEHSDAVVLDIRSMDAYFAGHIPNALSTPYAEGWRTTVKGTVGQLPHIPVIEQKIALLGVDDNEHVVVVTSGKSYADYAAAARVYWTFKVLGHEDVSLLNGGYAAWLEAGLATDMNMVTAEKGDFSAQLTGQYIVDSTTLNGELEQWQTIDARSTHYFSGKEKFSQARVGGTIPGSVNLMHTMAFVGRQVVTFADIDTLKAKAKEAGINLNAAKTATFCNTGHLGSTQWFVMSELLGMQNTALFDGSMTEWTADQARPVQTAKRGLGKLFGG